MTMSESTGFRAFRVSSALLVYIVFVSPHTSAARSLLVHQKAATRDRADQGNTCEQGAPTYSFTGTNGGQWSTPGFWSPPGPPPAGAMVVIAQMQQQQIVLDSDISLCGLQLGSDSGASEVTVSLRLEGSTLSMGGSVVAYPGTTLEIAGMLEGQSAGVPLQINGGWVQFESGSITDMIISTESSGRFSFVSEQAHTFDNTELTCSSTTGKIQHRRDNSQVLALPSSSCEWEAGPLFLENNSVLKVTGGSLLWSAPAGQQLLSMDATGLISITEQGQMVVQPRGGTTETSIQLPITTKVEDGSLIVEGCTLQLTSSQGVGGLALSGDSLLDFSTEENPAAVVLYSAALNVTSEATILGGASPMMIEGGSSMSLEGSFVKGSLNVLGGQLLLGDQAALSSVTIDRGGAITSLASEDQAASINELFFFTGYFEGNATIGTITFDTPNDLSGTKTVTNGHMICKQADFIDTEGSGATLLTMTDSTLVINDEFTVGVASSFVCDSESVIAIGGMLQYSHDDNGSAPESCLSAERVEGKCLSITGDGRLHIMQGAEVKSENGGVVAISTEVLWEGKLSVNDDSTIIFGGTAAKIFSQSIQQ